MTGMLWAEVRRFAVRPAIRWIAAGMLLYVAFAVALTAVEVDVSTLAERIEQGEIASYALTTVFLAAVAGVLLVTGEAASGGTRALLIVDPRRGRVYWSKLVAAGLAVLPGVAVAYALLASCLYGLHARADLLGGAPSDLVSALAWSGVRVLALAVCAAAVGAALGMLVRDWRVAVALLVVWVVVEDRALGVTSPARDWLPLTNADVWVRGTGDLSGAAVLAVPLVHSALLLLGLTLVLTVLGALVFRRRDVR